MTYSFAAHLMFQGRTEEAMNLYAEVFPEAEIRTVGDYGFSEMFGWLQDRFGVSWQLNLP